MSNANTTEKKVTAKTVTSRQIAFCNCQRLKAYDVNDAQPGDLIDGTLQIQCLAMGGAELPNVTWGLLSKYKIERGGVKANDDGSMAYVQAGCAPDIRRKQYFIKDLTETKMAAVLESQQLADEGFEVTFEKAKAVVKAVLAEGTLTVRQRFTNKKEQTIESGYNVLWSDITDAIKEAKTMNKAELGEVIEELFPNTYTAKEVTAAL